VRCLVDVPGEKLPADLPGYLAREVAPELPEGLQAAFLEAAQSGNIRSMQNKQLSCQPLHQPGEACGRQRLVCSIALAIQSTWWPQVQAACRGQHPRQLLT
jgi:hypothetical protein